MGIEVKHSKPEISFLSRTTTLEKLQSQHKKEKKISGQPKQQGTVILQAMPLLCSCACAQSGHRTLRRTWGAICLQGRHRTPLAAHSSPGQAPLSPHGAKPCSLLCSRCCPRAWTRCAPGIGTAVLHPVEMSTSQQLLTFSTHELQSSRSPSW